MTNECRKTPITGPVLLLASALAAIFQAAPAASAEPAPVLETVALVDQAPGNIAVAPDGTVIITVHPAMPSQNLALAISNGESRPFPNPAWSSPQRVESGEPGLQPVLGIRADRNGLVWMLSNRNGQHLYAWDTRQDRLAHEFVFDGPPAANDRSSFNDIALAPDHGTVFLSDASGDENSAIVAVDIATGNARRRLQGHPSMRAEAVTAYIDGKALGNTGPNGEFSPLRGALNPITIDAAEQWVYYGAMSGRWIYRVRVDDLLDDSLSEEDLGARVERYAAKPPCAGITIDDAGNIYVTDIQARGIGVAAPGQDYRLLVSDPERLDWPDGLSVGPDGYIYTGANHLYRNFSSHRDGDRPRPPYYITRFKALAGTTVGR